MAENTELMLADRDPKPYGEKVQVERIIRVDVVSNLLAAGKRVGG